VALGTEWFHGVLFHADGELDCVLWAPHARNVAVSARMAKTQAARVKQQDAVKLPKQLEMRSIT